MADAASHGCTDRTVLTLIGAWLVPRSVVPAERSQSAQAGCGREEPGPISPTARGGMGPGSRSLRAAPAGRLAGTTAILEARIERRRGLGIADGIPFIAIGTWCSHYRARGGAAPGNKACDFVRLCQPRPPPVRGRAGEPRATLLCRRCRKAQTAAPDRSPGGRSSQALRFTHPGVGFGHMSG